MLKRKDQKNRRLELNTSTIRNLQAGDLMGVAGGAASLSVSKEGYCSVSSNKLQCGEICYHSL